jgi:hypothetical protein
VQTAFSELRRRRLPWPRRTTNHARLTKAKNVPAGVSERQALSKLMRCCRSREPIIKYGSRLASMSRFDNGSRLAGIENCADVFPISCWERSAYLLKRLLICVGILKLLEGLLLLLATMASCHAEDRCLAKDGGEVRI